MLSTKETPEGVTFTVFVQPRSSKNMIAGAYGDAVKLKLTAPPVGGAANKMCINFLAKYLRVPKSSLEIISGHTNRTKRVLLRYTDKSCKGGRKQLKDLIESLIDEKTA